MAVNEVASSGAVVEYINRGRKGDKGDKGDPGKGILLLEATAVIPDDIPPDTEVGTIVYQKNA